MTAATTQEERARYRGRRAAGTALVALALGSVVVSLVLETLERDWTGGFPPALSVLPFLAVAALVVRRQPENPIGSLLAVVTFLLATGGLSERLAFHFLGRPLGTWAAWYGEWWWVPMLTLLLVVIPLTFPDGELLSRRWRPVLLIALTTTTVAVAGAWFQSELGIGIGEPGEVPTVPNPIGVAPWPEMEEAFPGWAFFGTLFPGALLGVASLVLRFRRSRGVERQQLKWAAFGLGGFGAGFLTNAVVSALFDVHLPGLLEVLLIFAIPVAFGFAILRYRLYDIDRIIHRTIAYVVLSALLVGIYVTGVIVLGGLVRSVSGGGDLVVAASTVAVAGAFQPLRHRVQTTVDRHFNRARYDARRTVEELASRLREEVDLALLAASVEQVARSTIQPTHVSIWFAEGRP